MLGEQDSGCTVGVIHDAAAGTIALSCLDVERRSLSVETMPISSLKPRELGLFRGDGLPEQCDDPEIQNLDRLIGQLCRSRAPDAVLLAVPKVLPDPDFAENQQPPLAVFDPGSPLLKVIFVLATSGCVSCLATVLDHSDARSRIAVRQVPQEQRADRQLPKQPLFLNTDLLMACAALVTDAQVSAPRAAAMAAVLGAWPSSYSYWSSFGRMFRPTEIVSALRTGQSRTNLGTSSEMVTVRWNSRRNAEIVDRVLPEHAAAMHKHAHLDEMDALKVALVTVAKSLRVTVTCRSERADAVMSKYTEVWPPREPFVWAVDLVRQQP